MLYLVSEAEFTVGRETQVFAESPLSPHYAAVFEDDGQTAYFYALDTRNEQPVAEALHIYNVADVSDSHLPCQAQICWHHNQEIAVLFINGYPHAALDFAERFGLNRNGFPEPAAGSIWQRALLEDELVRRWYEEAADPA